MTRLLGLLASAVVLLCLAAVPASAQVDAPKPDVPDLGDDDGKDDDDDEQAPEVPDVPVEVPGGAPIDTPDPSGGDGDGGGGGGSSDTNDSGPRPLGSSFESSFAVTPLSGLRMVPFPIVRIRGVIVRGGVSLQIVSVFGPSGATIEVICSGRCPARRQARAPSSAAGPRLARFEAFEHHFIPAGSKLRFKVTRPGRLGKYTRFTIRTGRVPLRGDLCMFHRAASPIGCPG